MACAREIDRERKERVGEREVESRTIGLIRDPLHLSLKHFNNSLVLNYFGRLLLLNPLFICLPHARYTHTHTQNHIQTRSRCIHLAAGDKCMRHPASSSRPGRHGKEGGREQGGRPLQSRNVSVFCLRFFRFPTEFRFAFSFCVLYHSHFRF